LSVSSPERLQEAELQLCIDFLGVELGLTEMSTRSRKIMFLGCKERPGRRADNLAAICKLIVYTVWDP
jgi:hypothetical protein